MGRSPCCDKNGLKKGPWTQEEDTKLTQYIQTHGPGNWRTLPKNAGLQRCGKSCRLRWTNYLRPDIKRGRFSFEEEESIIQLHSVLGNNSLPGRTDNEIKNYWNTHIRKRLLRMGIDPVTHAPRLDFMDLSSLLNSPQLNLPNLLRLQTLLNPEALRLALNLVSMNSNDQSPDILLQRLQENQLLNTHNQLQNQAPFFQPNQFENIINQQIPSNLTTPSIQNGTTDMGHYSMNSRGQVFQDNLAPTTTTSESLPTNLPNFFDGSLYGQVKADLSSENSSFQSLNSSCSNSHSQNFTFDSVLSTPLSSPPPLNSVSSLMNDLLRFEIPESLNLDDFM